MSCKSRTISRLPGTGAGYRFVEPRYILADMMRIVGEQSGTLGLHFGKRFARVVFEMPLRRNHISKEPVQFLRVGYNLGEKHTQIPLVQNVTNVENNRVDRIFRRQFCPRRDD